MGEVAENNKLIAKFMGYKEIDDDKFTISRTGQIEKLTCDFDYDCQWNKLMPVIEKIEHLVDEEILGSVDFRIGSGEIIVKANNHLIYLNDGYTEDDSKIEAVYHGVVAFIIWYNANVKPEKKTSTMNEGYCSDNFRIGDVIYCVDYYDEKLAELFVELINDSFIRVGYGRNFSKRHDLYYHKLSIPAEKREVGAIQFFADKREAMRFKAILAEKQMEDKISKIAKIADTIVGVADENYSYLSDKAIRKMKSARYIQHETGKYKKKEL